MRADVLITDGFQCCLDEMMRLTSCLENLCPPQPHWMAHQGTCQRVQKSQYSIAPGGRTEQSWQDSDAMGQLCALEWAGKSFSDRLPLPRS